MNFTINVDDIKNQRAKQEKDDDEKNQEKNNTAIISQEIDGILEKLNTVRTVSPENIVSVNDLIKNMFCIIQEIDIVQDFLIEDNMLCDKLMHFLCLPFSNETLCMIHDIFRHIYVSSEKCASIVFHSGYFHQSVNFFYTSKFDPKDEEHAEERESIFSRVIHSLRFGIQFFKKISELFFDDKYKDRFIYLLKECNFSNNVIHELICLTDSMISSRPEKDVALLITPVLLDYFIDPNYTKICCDTLIRCTKFPYLYKYLSNYFVKNNKGQNWSTDLISLVLTVLSSNDQVYDIKAKVKSFVLLSNILYFFQSNSPKINPSQLTVDIITVDFLNSNIVGLLNPEIVTKPKHLEMIINSISQISLNDPSIPSVICESDVFQTLLELVNNPNVTFYVGIACRLLFASLLRTDNTDLEIHVFEGSFNYLIDLFESEEPEFIIEAVDAILFFLEKMSNDGQTEIIMAIVNDDDYSWVRESLEECLESPVERIAHTSEYIVNQFFKQNEQDETA